ncbi:hypothetical protein E2C01_021415 [Portunus trituberculatus]|uniref:Uncharacterized protein n=1 Tax=Portunus trituberculatus TaxID=210409 RepID=A0A5B7E474_PORTR|nr:hypothetical protein [Portunus trituberculatus]
MEGATAPLTRGTLLMSSVPARRTRRTRCEQNFEIRVVLLGAAASRCISQAPTSAELHVSSKSHALKFKCREGSVAAEVGRGANQTSSFGLDSLDERTLGKYN